MKYTPKLSLKKPDPTDAVKRSDFNDNWDLLDTHKHDLIEQTGILPIEKGGTGAGTAADARVKLGANNAANLSTGTLNADRLPVVPVVKGGTGADNAQAARESLGAAGTAIATHSTGGLMSAADKAKLDGVAAGATNYTHPNSGVTAGSYHKVAVNAQGHVTAGSNDPLPISEGGTGKTTAVDARAALGAPPVSHAADNELYGIATALLYGHAMASSAAPVVAGTANAGTDNGKFAREGHVHPAQTSVSANAGTATKLATARTINGASFDGSWNISFGALYPAEIPESANLDSYFQSGMYYCPANATVETVKSAPTGNAFFLLIGRHAGTYQMVIEHMTVNPKIYFRNYFSAWGSWYRLYTTCDAQTTISGNSGSTTKLQTARSFSIGGGATAASINFDGTGNVALNVTALDVDKADAGTLPIARGGTSATDAATARTQLGITPGNIGAATASHTHDASNISTGTLSLARGGTGATTAKAAMNSIGISYVATLPTGGTDGQVCLIPV